MKEICQSWILNSVKMSFKEIGEIKMFPGGGGGGGERKALMEVKCYKDLVLSEKENKKDTKMGQINILWLSNSAPQYIMERLCTCTPGNMNKNVNSNLVHNSKTLEQSKCLNSEVNKLWHIHTMEYYIAMKMNALQTHVSMDGSPKRNVELKKKGHKRIYLVWFCM